MVYESRYYTRPADEVAAVNEAKANYAQAKAAEQARAELEKLQEQTRIREKIMRKVRR